MFGVAALLLIVAMALALVRALRGPTVFDRILAVNVIGTATVALISTLGFIVGRDDLVDIALIYALISFTATLAVLRFSDHERAQRAANATPSDPNAADDGHGGAA